VLHSTWSSQAVKLFPSPAKCALYPALSSPTIVRCLSEYKTRSACFSFTGAVHTSSIIQNSITYSCAWMQELMVMMQGLLEGPALPTQWWVTCHSFQLRTSPALGYFHQPNLDSWSFRFIASWSRAKIFDTLKVDSTAVCREKNGSLYG